METSESIPAQSPVSTPRELAQRLHDDLCQTLTSTTYLAAILKKNLETRGAEEAAQAEEISSGLREASRAVRALIEDLRRPGDPPNRA